MHYRFLTKPVSEWIHEIQAKWIPECDSHGNSAGNCFGCCSGKSGADAAVGACDAAVLLPLRVRDRHETLHEDVRVAAIPKSLVGNLLPQEELDCE
jgi:hypothetical protein